MSLKRLSLSLPLLLSVILLSSCTSFQTEAIAHRGHWNAPLSAQNSLKAVECAAAVGAWGAEFDVQSTKDRKLIVFHNSSIGETNIPYSEYAKIADHKLKNGESIPSLDQYLDAFKKNSLRLILELKTSQGGKPLSDLVNDSIAAVTSHKLLDRTDWISFSWEACLLVRKALPNADVYYLGDNKTPQDVLAAGLSGLDSNLHAYRKNPGWVEELHAHGLKANVWTVNSAEDLRWCLEQKFDFVTTDNPALFLQIREEFTRK